MSISFISFLIALVVITFLLVLLMKQKAKPAPRVYKPMTDEGLRANDFNVGLVQSKWAEIQIMQNSGPSGLKAALIEADKLLDYCMKSKGFSGETMGDRLKSGGSKFSNLNEVWNAHKLRNEIAHNIEHDIVASQVKHAVGSLGNAIRDLGVRL